MKIIRCVSREIRLYSQTQEKHGQDMLLMHKNPHVQIIFAVEDLLNHRDDKEVRYNSETSLQPWPI